MTSVLLSAIRELGNAYRKMNENKGPDQKLRMRVSALETQVITELQKFAAASNATSKPALTNPSEVSALVVTAGARSHIIGVNKKAYPEISTPSDVNDGVAGSRSVSSMPRLLQETPSSLKDCRQPLSESSSRPALYKEQFSLDENLLNIPNIQQRYDAPQWFDMRQNNSSYDRRNPDFVQYRLPNVLPARHEAHNSVIQEAHRPLMAVASVSGMTSVDHSSSEQNYHHRPLDRSVSEPLHKSNITHFDKPALIIDPSRYKTELCRAFEENGSCPYNRKCQFAHGVDELRVVPRNPRYKTEFCRAFHSTGICPYGRRCLFIHNDFYRSRINSVNLPFGVDTLSHEQDFCTQSIGSAGELSPSTCSVSNSPTFSTGFMEDSFKHTDPVSIHPVCALPAANTVLNVGQQKSIAAISTTQPVPYRWDEGSHDSSVIDQHLLLSPVSPPLISQVPYVQQKMPSGSRKTHQLDNRQEASHGGPTSNLQKPMDEDIGTVQKGVPQSQNIARLPVFAKICNQKW